MSKSVNVDIDISGVSIAIEHMRQRGQYALINQVHADMNNYVPALDHDLRNQSTMANDAKSIIYNVPYARKQFYIRHRNYTTAGTGARWDKVAKTYHRKSWSRVIKAVM